MARNVREAPKMGESEKWEALMRSIRKAAHILNIEQDLPDYLNWRVARDMNERLWARVKLEKKTGGNPMSKVTVECPLCGDVIEVPEYDRVTRSDALKEHLEKECRAKRSMLVYPRTTLPEPLASQVRAELRKIPTWKLEEAYGTLKAGQPTGIEVLEANRAHALSAVREILYERGRDPEAVVEGVYSMRVGNPVSEHCRRVLAEPPRCFSFRDVRAYTMCWAWKEMEEKKLSRLPIKDAWAQVRRVCKME